MPKAATTFFARLGPVALSGLYALTPDLLDTDELLARAESAIAGGASALQYRNKIASPPLKRAQALALRDLCAARGIPFIVNDDVNLAFAVDADGVHLGRDDAPVARARQRLGASAIIGASCYDSLTALPLPSMPAPITLPSAASFLRRSSPARFAPSRRFSPRRKPAGMSRRLRSAGLRLRPRRR